jgi:hypothetical protein
METGYERAVATLVVLADGTTSMYFSNGGGSSALVITNPSPRLPCSGIGDVPCGRSCRPDLDLFDAVARVLAAARGRRQAVSCGGSTAPTNGRLRRTHDRSRSSSSSLATMALTCSTHPAGRATGHWASCTRFGVQAGAVVSLSNGAAAAEARPPTCLPHAPPRPVMGLRPSHRAIREDAQLDAPSTLLQGRDEHDKIAAYSGRRPCGGCRDSSRDKGHPPPLTLNVLAAAHPPHSRTAQVANNKHECPTSVPLRISGRWLEKKYGRTVVH